MARIDPQTVYDKIDVIGPRLERLEFTVQRLFEKSNEMAALIVAKDAQLAKMTDRMIELAMVRQGAVVDSVAHRRAAALEEAGQTKQSVWEGETEDEDEWPPKGFQTYPTP